MNTAAPESVAARPIRLGVVSFLNTLPLIDGLDGLRDVEFHRSVPSLLIDKLLADEVDVALCSSIDYQRSPEPLVIVPAGLLGCDGPTLTVRLYSHRPIHEIERVYCDTDSHTSVVLMQILLREMHGRAPEIVDYDAREHVAANRPLDWPEAMLLIGDKVVTDSPPAVRYPHQLDLGAAWRELTGRGFVFAMWLARRDADRQADPDRLRIAAAILDRQLRYNRTRLDVIIHANAERRHWPRDLAATYLKKNLSYEATDERLAAVDLFFEKAYEHGLVDKRRPLEIA
jgi:chorismate dehydratase